MGDHYDTAYMEDHYGYGHGGKGPRLAAAGADDNHSATAALMLGRPDASWNSSRQGKLACDVWLVHLTGEEFPSDCMGARHLCQRLVERSLQAAPAPTAANAICPKSRARGVYVLDMVAHNNDRDRDVFQICPGDSRQSLWLAYQAHVANHTWNESAPLWNSPRGPQRARPRQALHRRPHDAGRRSAPASSAAKCAPGTTRGARFTTPTAKSFPTPACPSCCSWRTTTSIAKATTTATTRWKTSTSTTARPWPRSPSNRSPARRRRRCRGRPSEISNLRSEIPVQAAAPACYADGMVNRLQISLLKLLLIAAAYGIGFRIFPGHGGVLVFGTIDINRFAAGVILGTILSLYVIFFRTPISIFLATAAGGMMFSARVDPGDQTSAAVFGAVAGAALAWLLSVARPPNQWRYE